MPNLTPEEKEARRKKTNEEKRKVYNERRDKGQCPYCGNPAMEIHVLAHVYNKASRKKEAETGGRTLARQEHYPYCEDHQGAYEAMTERQRRQRKNKRLKV